MTGELWLWIVIAVVVVALVAVVVGRVRTRPPVESGTSPSGATPRPARPAASSPAGEAAPVESRAAPAPETTATPAATEPEVPSRPADPALAALDNDRAGATGIATPGGGVAAGAVDAVAAASAHSGPHPGSALPAADGSSPSGEYTIKANTGSSRYHEPASPYYFRTRADLWFRSAAEAEQAGFVSWNGRAATG